MVHKTDDRFCNIVFRFLKVNVFENPNAQINTKTVKTNQITKQTLKINLKKNKNIPAF